MQLRSKKINPVAAAAVAFGCVALVVGLVAYFALFAPRSLPRNFAEIADPPVIYPDYRETTLPPNVAPTNFRIETDAKRYLTKISGESGDSFVVSGRDVVIPPAKWRRLLAKNCGKSIFFDVFAQGVAPTAAQTGANPDAQSGANPDAQSGANPAPKSGGWTKFATIRNAVSADPIDGWVAYRLIEPGYDSANRIALVQRDLSTFDERVFFDNRATESCVNCHSFQNRETKRFLFHYRKGQGNPLGGTIVVDGGRARKISGKVEPFGGACSYPAWRPTGDFVAFSTNKTFQAFHNLSSQKIEVFDVASELVLLNAKTNEATQITATPDVFETFPSWSPDGKSLYYCAATVAVEAKTNEKNEAAKEIANRTSDFRYNVIRRTFDERTGVFGAPETVVDAASRSRSALFPRVSPDGRFLVYTLAESGTFPIWRPEADLWLKDLTTGEERPLTEINGDETDSFHNWDSSGRWLVFASRRDDGQYTRLYFAYFDANGKASKPFVLPQRDPQGNRRRFKSYNVPELTVESIKVSERELMRAAKNLPEPTKSRE